MPEIETNSYTILPSIRHDPQEHVQILPSIRHDPYKNMCRSCQVLGMIHTRTCADLAKY